MLKCSHILSFYILTTAFTTVNSDSIMAQYQINDSVVLTGGDTEAGDYFGYSVDISNDRAVIGAYLDDDNGSNSGSVYVFHIEDGNWVQEAKLHASDGKANDWLGWSVAISEDTIVAGANRDNEAGDWTGSAYVFRYEGTSWVEQQKLLADATGHYWEEFGFDAAISADSNTILIGACKANDNGFKSGAAYIFRYDGTTWFQQAKLLASDGAELATFGNSVAISDDGNTVLIGAPGNDSNGRTYGSVYVFACENGSWIEKQKLLAHDAAHGDHFGWSLAVSRNILVTGAYGDDNSEPDNVYCNSGSAYIFNFDGKQWVEQAKLQSPSGECLSQFGWSVDVFDNNVIIGEPDGSWGTTSGSGNAYLFTFNGLRWIQRAKLVSDGVRYGDHFGWSAAISEKAVLIGSELSDINGLDSGAAYGFDVNLIPGDFDCDGIVGYSDLCIFASAWLARYGDTVWNPVCDIGVKADDVIDISDLTIFAENWLKNMERKSIK